MGLGCRTLIGAVKPFRGGHGSSLTPIQLFNRQNRYNTFVGLLFGLGSLMAIWTTVSWLPTILQQLAEKTGMANPGEVKNHGIMLWSVGGIFGYAAFGFIADWIGRHWTVALYSIG